jgi:hypothetical protein
VEVETFGSGVERSWDPTDEKEDYGYVANGQVPGEGPPQVAKPSETAKVSNPGAAGTREAEEAKLRRDLEVEERRRRDAEAEEAERREAESRAKARLAEEAGAEADRVEQERLYQEAKEKARQKKLAQQQTQSKSKVEEQKPEAAGSPPSLPPKDSGPPQPGGGYERPSGLAKSVGFEQNAKELPPQPGGGYERPSGLPKAVGFDQNAKELPPEFPAADSGYLERRPTEAAVADGIEASTQATGREGGKAESQGSASRTSTNVDRLGSPPASTDIGISFVEEMTSIREDSMGVVNEDEEAVEERPETPVDEQGQKLADVAEEQAFTRSYNEIRANRSAQPRSREATSSTDKASQQATQTLLEQLRPADRGVDQSAFKVDIGNRGHVWKSGKDKRSAATPEKKVPRSPPSQPSRGLVMGVVQEKSGYQGQQLPREDEFHLPPLVRSNTSPAELAPSRGYDNVISQLQEELDSERLERERMSKRVKELEVKLERSMERSASQPASKSTGKGGPYKGAPVPPPPPSPPKRSLHLPPLKTLPSPKPSQERQLERQAAQAAAAASMEMARSQENSRAERSKARVEAIGRLQQQGMNNWQERKAEKVSRLHDLTVFRESMWNSFHQWHEDYQLQN